MKHQQFATHNETGAPCVVLGANTVHYQVQWLESGGESDVPITDVTLVDVPTPQFTFIAHGVNARHLRMLEDTFTKLTPDGWVTPDWIEILR